jgi:hypothetical protein
MDCVEIGFRNLHDPIPLVEDRENILTYHVCHYARVLTMKERHTIGTVVVGLGIFILLHS